MKKKVLIVFKYPHYWNVRVIKKFSNYYDTEHLYISDLKNKNFKEIINEINNLVKSKNIEIVIFDVDYFKFINLFFIEKVNCKKKVLFTGDDFELHELHSVTASACDLILSHCPLSVLKYKEKGYESYIFPLETLKINKNNVVKKEIDVLFFGNLTPDRKGILNYIEKDGIILKNVGYESEIAKLPDDELQKLISKSKIILNLSKSRSVSSINNFASENIYKFSYQLKGRIWDAGLNGVVCVSEYSPGQELLFNEDEIPTFYKKEECVEILKKLLNNDELLTKYRNKFTSKIYNLCEKFNNLEPICHSLEKPNNRRVKLIKIPYWYLRIAAKQIVLRNIKLSNLIKTIFQFNIIFEIIKNSNFQVKSLIILESIINILWYSLLFTSKSKK